MKSWCLVFDGRLNLSETGDVTGAGLLAELRAEIGAALAMNFSNSRSELARFVDGLLSLSVLRDFQFTACDDLEKKLVECRNAASD